MPDPETEYAVHAEHRSEMRYCHWAPEGGIDTFTATCSCGWESQPSRWQERAGLLIHYHLAGDEAAIAKINEAIGREGDRTTSFTVTEMADRVERALRTVPLAILREGGTAGLSGGEYVAMALAVATMLAGED
jgi:hypothetical protein